MACYSLRVAIDSLQQIEIGVILEFENMHFVYGAQNVTQIRLL